MDGQVDVCSTLVKRSGRLGVRLPAGMQEPLTCHLQRRVAADGFAKVVPCHAHVDALVRLAPPPVDDSQEEERAAGQDDAMGPGVLSHRLDTFAVFVPLQNGGRPSLRLAVECGRLALGHDQVGRVLGDPRRRVL